MTSKLPSQFPVGKTHLTMISLMKNIMKSIKLQCFDDSRVIQLMSPFSGYPNVDADKMLEKMLLLICVPCIVCVEIF